MKLKLTLIFSFISICTFAQLRVDKIDRNEIPKNLKYQGKAVYAVKWTDSLGENVVIATETGKMQSKTVKDDDGFKDAALYAYHYILGGNEAKLLWKINDFDKECPFDLEVYFINKGFAITDLDNNGIAEVWMIYRNNCRSDYSPMSSKIIMYEGDKKYALRGHTRIKATATTFMGGDYKLDPAFSAKPIFKKHVLSLWAQYQSETWNKQ